jgi:hypothetical protein
METPEPFGISGCGFFAESRMLSAGSCSLNQGSFNSPTPAATLSIS